MSHPKRRNDRRKNKRSRLFTKILAIMIVLFGVISIATSLLSGWSLYRHIAAEYRSKGTAISKSIAESGVDLILNRDASIIQSTVDQYRDIQGVAYVYVVDADGDAVSHTFSPKIPDYLVQHAAETHHHDDGSYDEIDEHIILSDIDLPGPGSILNIRVPMLGGMLGFVHVGMDKRLIFDVIMTAIIKQQIVIFLIFLFATGLSYLLVRQITRPLDALTDYAHQLGDHKWDSKIDVQSTDELGLLARTMQGMASNLHGYFDRLESDIAKATSQLREKNATLKDTLDTVKSMQKQLVTQEKMASLGELTSGIAHEIKNPLNFVCNFSDLSKDLSDELVEEIQSIDGKIDSEVYEEILDISHTLKENASKINEHGRRADSIVQSMLEHSQRDGGEVQELDIRQLILSSVDLAYKRYISTHATFTAQIETNLSESLPSVTGIAHDLTRVIVNACDNAFFAMDEKKSGHTNFQPVLTVSSEVDGSSVVIRIRDNGMGMNSETCDKIFMPFFTTRPTGQGSTGLGMSLSHDIVVQGHHGQLTAESEEGEYTMVSIALPIAPPETHHE